MDLPMNKTKENIPNGYAVFIEIIYVNCGLTTTPLQEQIVQFIVRHIIWKCYVYYLINDQQ